MENQFQKPNKGLRLEPSTKLNIVFAGTPDIATYVLQKLLNHDAYLNQDWQISLVLTQPDRPRGRGQKLVATPVKQLAIQNNIKTVQPVSFKRNPEVIDLIANIQPDIMIVVAYGLILPERLLHIPRLGCVNVHVSLLPKWRGAAPIQRAIQNGDHITGVTIMQMDNGLDTGNILIQKPISISNTDNAQILHDKLAEIGSSALIEYLQNYWQIQSIPQSDIGTMYANKISKSEAKINWQNDALTISRQIRAFNPTPGCYTQLNGKIIKIWDAKPISTPLNTTKQGIITFFPIKVGTIVNYDRQSETIQVLCGNNSILGISILQEASKKRQLAKDFIKNKNLEAIKNFE